MKKTKLSLVVGLGIVFIVTAPVHSHIKCPVKFLGTTNDKCPHIHRKAQKEAYVSMGYYPTESDNAKRLRLERENQARIKKQEDEKWKRAQVQQEREAKARRVQEENDRIYREQRVQEKRQRMDRISSEQRVQVQDALRNIDRERNYISQPTRNEEIMRAEENFARALRNVRG